jgi:hypothetical protein
MGFDDRALRQLQEELGPLARPRRRCRMRLAKTLRTRIGWSRCWSVRWHFGTGRRIIGCVTRRGRVCVGTGWPASIRRVLEPIQPPSVGEVVGAMQTPDRQWRIEAIRRGSGDGAGEAGHSVSDVSTSDRQRSDELGRVGRLRARGVVHVVVQLEPGEVRFG